MSLIQSYSFVEAALIRTFYEAVNIYINKKIENKINTEVFLSLIN